MTAKNYAGYYNDDYEDATITSSGSASGAEVKVYVDPDTDVAVSLVAIERAISHIEQYLTEEV